MATMLDSQRLVLAAQLPRRHWQDHNFCYNNHPASGHWECCPRCVHPQNVKYERSRSQYTSSELHFKAAITKAGYPLTTGPWAGCSHWSDNLPRWLDHSPHWQRVFTSQPTKTRRIAGLESGYCHDNTTSIAWNFPKDFQAFTGLARDDEHGGNWIHHSWLLHDGIIYECGRWTFTYYVGIGPLTEQELAQHYMTSDNVKTPDQNFPEPTANNVVTVLGKRYSVPYKTPTLRQAMERKIFTLIK